MWRNKKMSEITFQNIEEIKSNGFLTVELAQELKKQNYINGNEIDACAIDFKKDGEFFLKLILGTQLRYNLDEEDLNTDLIEMEMPRELVPFLLDFNRISPFILFEGKYFAAYVSKYLELILVPLKEKPDDNYLIFDVSI